MFDGRIADRYADQLRRYRRKGTVRFHANSVALLDGNSHDRRLYLLSTVVNGLGDLAFTDNRCLLGPSTLTFVNGMALGYSARITDNRFEYFSEAYSPKGSFVAAAFSMGTMAHNQSDACLAVAAPRMVFEGNLQPPGVDCSDIEGQMEFVDRTAPREEGAEAEGAVPEDEKSVKTTSTMSVVGRALFTPTEAWRQERQFDVQLAMGRHQETLRAWLGHAAAGDVDVDDLVEPVERLLDAVRRQLAEFDKTQIEFPDVGEDDAAIFGNVGRVGRQLDDGQVVLVDEGGERIAECCPDERGNFELRVGESGRPLGKEKGARPALRGAHLRLLDSSGDEVARASVDEIGPGDKIYRDFDHHCD